MNACGDMNESGGEANACNSSTQGAEAGGLQGVGGQPVLQSKMPQLKERRAGKVAQWVKVCAYKSEVPSSIPGICRMENENQPHTVSSDPPQAHTHT